MTKKELIEALSTANDDQEIDIILWPQREGFSDVTYYRLGGDALTFELGSVSVHLDSETCTKSLRATIWCGDPILEE